MKDKHDRIILYLSVSAIVIVILAFASVNIERLNLPFFTGLATTSTATGFVNITIANTIAISLNTSVVNFGNGSLAPPPFYTAVNTTPPANPSTFDDPYALVVRNDGNVGINITINGSTAAQFFPGASNPSYMWNASENETGSCLANITGGIVSMTNVHRLVCSNLTFTDTNDEIKIDIYLNLSPNTPTNIEYKDEGIQIIGSYNIP